MSNPHYSSSVRPPTMALLFGQGKCLVQGEDQARLFSTCCWRAVHSSTPCVVTNSGQFSTRYTKLNSRSCRKLPLKWSCHQKFQVVH